jgi:hypothetical protein
MRKDLLVGGRGGGGRGPGPEPSLCDVDAPSSSCWLEGEGGEPAGAAGTAGAADEIPAGRQLEETNARLLPEHGISALMH